MKYKQFVQTNFKTHMHFGLVGGNLYGSMCSACHRKCFSLCLASTACLFVLNQTVCALTLTFLTDTPSKDISVGVLFSEKAPLRDLCCLMRHVPF